MGSENIALIRYIGRVESARVRGNRSAQEHREAVSGGTINET